MELKTRTHRVAGLQSAGVSFRREKGQPQFWRKHGPYPCGIRGGGRSLVPHVCMWAAGRLRDIQPGQSELWEGTGRGAAVSTGEGPYLPTFPTAELRMSELAQDGGNSPTTAPLPTPGTQV